MVNVWATWCIACRQEHGMLLAIARSGKVPIYGLNYKDNREDAIRWLDRLGDPYVATGVDLSGQVGIDFGVYGVPETYVLESDGFIAYKHIGPITDEVWTRMLLPLIRKLKDARG
jgi:cytochrome c biogenesis protein CcmG/thiol:disulfide interchange protein DsbE